MLGHFIAVGFGGALGAMARYGVGIGAVRAFGHGFPVGVLSVNIVGSFLMGVFFVLAAQRGLTAWSPFVMTDFLGGFTTFSAFSLEAVTLYERGAVAQAGLYVALSVALSIGGLVLGIWLTRMWAQ
jgi:CrcB protein